MNKLKSSLLSICVLCFMALCWTTMSAQGSKARGDVDMDGSVTISDVTVLNDYLLGGREATINQAGADTNRDGTIDIGDVAVLIDYLLSGEWPYVPEPVTFTVNGVSFNMIPVSGGTFMMGGRDNDPYVRPWEFPVHQVTVSDFYIGETEVTQALWKAVMGSNPSWFQYSSNSDYAYTNDFQRPVEKVTYANCLSFISKLNQKTGKTFRLLTEAEWEFAARGGNRSRGYFYSGSDDIDEVSWYGDNSTVYLPNAGRSEKMPHAVATKAPNELGIYDMSGNVEEWTSDWYGLYTDEPQTNPTGPATGTARIVRGGSWDQAFRMSRPTYRHEGWPTSPNINIGLRIAMAM